MFAIALVNQEREEKKSNVSHLYIFFSFLFSFMAASAFALDYPWMNDNEQLNLTSNISIDDYRMGYCIIGTLERGYKKTNKYQQTHFVVIRRRWPSLKDTKSS